MIARHCPLRLASVDFVSDWFGLPPQEVVRLCAPHPGMMVEAEDGLIVDVRRFEAALPFHISRDLLHLALSKKARPGADNTEPREAQVDLKRIRPLTRPEHTSIGLR